MPFFPRIPVTFFSFRWSCRQNRRTARQSQFFSAEELEPRIVLTAGTVGVDDGVLSIQGTANDDTIVVTETASDFVVRASFLESVQLFPKGSVDVIVANGGAGDDNIVATSINKDVTLRGDDGNDRLFGGNGSDRIQGGSGHDIIYGNVGNDELFGGSGHDCVFGGAGNDILVGADGVDVLYGEAGDDRVLGGAGSDRLNGGSGQDRVVGGDGNDNLVGGIGNDLLFGDDGFDSLTGGGGEDRIFPGSQHIDINVRPADQCENIDLPSHVTARNGLFVVSDTRVLQIAACDPARHDATLEELAVARTRWESLDIDSYQFTYVRKGAWTRTGPITITVTNGEVVSAEDENGAAVELHVTVESVIGIIASEIDAEVSGLNAEFDPETGHPTRVFVNPFFQAYDEEYSITLTGFEIL